MIDRSVPCALLTACLLATCCPADDGAVALSVDGQPLVHYQARPLENPQGGNRFRGSNFIHPLKTPSGFVLTQIQPRDHLHHFALWWPWKYVESEGRKVLFWELQGGDGIIRAQGATAAGGGLAARSVYIDRKAPGGPRTLLTETANITTSPIVDEPARGYNLDLEIIHEVAGDKPLTVSKYRYSGFALRGTKAWNVKNSTILTSAGKTRDEANFTSARWVRVEGDTDAGATAGVILMSRPDNHAHPEKLRTWDRQHGGAVFINFNPVQDASWTFHPGKSYTRHYRLFVYDGAVTPDQAEALWKAYADEETQ